MGSPPSWYRPSLMLSSCNCVLSLLSTDFILEALVLELELCACSLDDRLHSWSLLPVAWPGNEESSSEDEDKEDEAHVGV